MAYIGQGIEQFSNVEKLDNITFTNSAGPYNLTKGSAAFTPSSVQSLLIQVDGVVQASDSYTVSGSTITFGVSMPSSSTMNNIIHFGVGLISTPGDDTVSTVKLAANSVTTAKINNLAVTDAKINTVAASKLTGALPAISGANLTNLPAETKPTIGSISPSVIENTQTAVTITGTNFISVPQVEAINSTGAIVAADSITYTSATQIVATFTLPVDGTYFLRVENNDGNAVRSGSAILTVSDAPAWTTAAGSIYTGASVVSTITLSATGATSFAVTTGSVPTGLTFTSGTGSCTIQGTQTEFTAAATKNFSITATDAEGQTAVRAFSMSFTFGMSGSGGFN